MKLSLARLCFVAFLTLELALSLTIFFLYQSEKDLASQPYPAGGEQTKRVLAGEIVGLTGRMRAVAELIAKHPQTIASLASGSEQERLAQLSNIEALYPDVSIRLLPADTGAAAGLYAAPLSAVHAQLPPNGNGGVAAKDAHGTSEGVLTIVQPVTDPRTKTLLGFFCCAW